MTVTKILGAQAGIQYQGVQDKSEADPRDNLVNALFTGEFKNGPFNKPFKITAANIRKALGFDPENLQYQAIEDLLKQGVPFVWVMRVNGGEGNWSCDTTPKIIEHPNLLPYNNNGYAIYYSYEGSNEVNVISLSSNTYTLDEGEYIDVGGTLNTMRYDFRDLIPETAELDYDQVACKVMDSYYPLRLRRGSGYWNNINAGQIKVVIDGSTHFMDYSAKSNISYMYEFYAYLIEFFDNLTPFLEGLGLNVTFLPDETFKDSYATSFNDGYLPKIEVRRPGYGMAGVTIQMVNTDNWMLDGYIHSGDCLERYSIDDVYQPKVTSSIRTLQEGDRNAEQGRRKIIFHVNETGYYENFLKAIGVKEDLVFKCCYIAGYEEES